MTFVQLLYTLYTMVTEGYTKDSIELLIDITEASESTIF